METKEDSELSGNRGREPAEIQPPSQPHTITAVDRKSVPPQGAICREFLSSPPRAVTRRNIPIKKARSSLRCCGLEESCEAAVDVGCPARRPLQAIPIELRSSGLVSPAGIRRRIPSKVAFGSQDGVPLSAEAAARGRSDSAPTQPRTRRIRCGLRERSNVPRIATHVPGPETSNQGHNGIDINRLRSIIN